MELPTVPCADKLDIADVARQGIEQMAQRMVEPPWWQDWLHRRGWSD